VFDAPLVQDAGHYLRRGAFNVTEKFPVDLSIKQAESIIKALEECHVNGGAFQRVVQSLGFDLAKPGEEAHTTIRHQLSNARNRKRAVMSDIQREASKPTEPERLREDNDSLRRQLSESAADSRHYRQLLEHVEKMLKAGETEAAYTAIRKQLYPWLSMGIEQ
jgi:hypothetical protein